MVIAIIIFLLFSFLLFYANIKKSKQITSDSNTKLSVIIAAKDEEKNIPKLILSLSNQTYPKENYEVIIVDDNSKDKTFEIAKNIIYELPNFEILQVLNKKYKGKRGALQYGIEKSKYPNILITDADCEAEPNWIQKFANKFNAGYDIIFGIAPYKQTRTLINKIACFENLRTHILTFAFANIGLPYSAAARSFGFKKKSFEQIEGYKNTTETLSGDDDLLLREAVKNNFRIATITEPDAFVFSETKKTFKEYLQQKARHTSTANYYSFSRQLLLGFWHLLNLFFLFSPFLIFFNIRFSVLFLIKFLTDIIIANLLMKKFGYRFNIFEIIYLQIIYEILLIINYINGLFSKRKW